jgi:HEAT repeat protein
VTELPLSNQVQETSVDWEIPELPLDQARELFTVLQKALRAFQLYDENNPVYQRFVSNLRTSFLELWEEVDELRVQVEEDRFLWYGAEVYGNTSRSESLAFLLYKDGIRDVRFVPGIEGEELEAFLRVLQRARNLRPEGDDLLTILWDADLEYLRYHYVDLLAEGVELPEKAPELGNLTAAWHGELAGEEDPRRPIAAAAQQEIEPPKPKVSADEFNPTLYSFDPREVEALRTELENEMSRDVRGHVLEALFDRIEVDTTPERQRSILGIFEDLLPNFLSHGELPAAAAVLGELQALLRGDGPGLAPAPAGDADRILDEVSGSAAIDELVASLVDGGLDASPQDLGAFLQHLRGNALELLLRAATDAESPRTRTTIVQAIAAIGERNRAAVVSLLEGDDPKVLQGACRLVGEMEMAQAGPALVRLADHEDAAVRLAAVESSVKLNVSTVAQGLEAALDDDDREVRIAAAKGLGELRYKPAAPAIKSIVTGRRIRHADISEKVAFFESYGAIGGQEAVELLGRLLTRKGLLGRREPEDIRASAALGLGRAGTSTALAYLREAHASPEPVVRSAIGRALKMERNA